MPGPPQGMFSPQQLGQTTGEQRLRELLPPPMLQGSPTTTPWGPGEVSPRHWPQPPVHEGYWEPAPEQRYSKVPGPTPEDEDMKMWRQLNERAQVTPPGFPANPIMQHMGPREMERHRLGTGW
jgi:hypothetical protein